LADDKGSVIETAPKVNVRAKALATLDRLPPFSPILNRLLASLARESSSFAQIGDLIEKDTVLAGNILKLVNSALYGRRSPITSVHHAVALLGVNKLRNAALGFSVSRMWTQIQTPVGWSMARFNLHSVATAMLADGLSQSAPVDYPEGAFIAGLFHDLGELLIAIGVPEEYEAIARRERTTGKPKHEIEMEVLGFTHGAVSSDALALWKLPPQVCGAVYYHQTPDAAPIGDGEIALATAVNAADCYVGHIGYSLDPSPASVDGASEEALACMAPLGIPGDELPAILEAFSTDFEALRAFF